MVRTGLLATLMLLLASTTVCAAQDAKMAKKKAAKCMACHGVNGISPYAYWPNLAGQKKTYIIKQLKDFKSGKRPHLMMTPMARRLSDEDVEIIAGYFANL